MRFRTDPSKEVICLSLGQLASWTAAQSHNHTCTRASTGGEAGWQRTLSSGLAPLGPISTTKSCLSLLSGPPAAHGNSRALEAAVPLPISQQDWQVVPAGTGGQVSHGQHPQQHLCGGPSLLQHDSCSALSQLHPPLLRERDNNLTSHPGSVSPYQV